jgi:hypothetical protein
LSPRGALAPLHRSELKPRAVIPDFSQGEPGMGNIVKVERALACNGDFSPRFDVCRSAGAEAEASVAG